jgi:hypothetical protein
MSENKTSLMKKEWFIMAGMGEESIDLSKLGTQLFAFGFVLVIGLSIFTIGKAITNDGSDKVQKQLEIVQQSEYSDYDQQTVLGTKVKSAYQNFEGKGCAILIATRAMIDDGASANGLPTKDSDWTFIQKKIVGSSGGSQVKVKGSDGFEHDLWCVNYNAILENGELFTENGSYVTKSSFLIDKSTGSVKYFNQVSNMKKQGMAEYIPTGAKYQSTLIKDTTGQVVGIVFVQVSSYN